MRGMTTATPLHTFIGTNRAELIRRCRLKVATRSSPLPTENEINYGVPLFLDQLVNELRDGPSKADAINEGAIRHGRDMLLQGYTISQVVHDYGDVCQSITDMAVETEAPIATDDFRTLNKCLDDAIAGAVTEHSRGEQQQQQQQQLAIDGKFGELPHLITTAITAFEVLKTGRVGIAGTTADLLHHSLLSIRALSGLQITEGAGLHSRRIPRA